MRTMTEILDTGAEAKWLLSTLGATLNEIRTRTLDDHGQGFDCFPFEWDRGNLDCVSSDSPVCVLCRALNEGTRERNHGPRKTNGDEHYMFVIDGEVRFYKKPFQDRPRR